MIRLLIHTKPRKQAAMLRAVKQGLIVECSASTPGNKSIIDLAAGMIILGSQKAMVRGHHLKSERWKISGSVFDRCKQ